MPPCPADTDEAAHSPHPCPYPLAQPCRCSQPTRGSLSNTATAGLLPEAVTHRERPLPTKLPRPHAQEPGDSPSPSSRTAASLGRGRAGRPRARGWGGGGGFLRPLPLRATGSPAACNGHRAGSGLSRAGSPEGLCPGRDRVPQGSTAAPRGRNRPSIPRPVAASRPRRARPAAPGQAPA